MRLPNVRRIIIEDYPEDVRPSIEKLAYILNQFMSDVTDLSTNRINFDNLYREIVTITVVVDANGVPTKNTTFATQVLSNAYGGIVLSATNKTNSQTFPTTAPFVSFISTKNNLFKVNNVTGLQANNTYELILEIVGK